MVKEVECHYRFPPCGNSSVFQLLTSVCENVCEYFRSLCFDVYNDLDVYYTSNAAIYEQRGMKAINCSNTGDSLDQLEHCCTDLGIKTQITTTVALPPECTKINDTYNSECVRSTSSESDSKNAVIGISIGVSLVITITIFISLLVKTTRKCSRVSTITNITERYNTVYNNHKSMQFHF